MRRLLVLFVLVNVAFLKLNAQHYGIELTFTGEKKSVVNLKEMIFKDTITNTVVKTIDVPAINPFYNLNYPEHVKASKRAGYKVYDLTGKKLTEVVPASVLKLYPYADPASIMPTRGQYSIDLRPSGDKAILSFTYSVGNDSAKLVEYSVVHVYKSDGTEIFSLVNHDRNILVSDVDPSGKYFFYTYGLRSNSKFVLPGGIKIMEIDGNKREMEFPGEEITAKFINQSSLYMFYNGIMHDGRPDRWLKVLDFNRLNMYTRCFTFNDMLLIKAVDSAGITYKNGDRDLFLSKFEIVDLDWKNYFTKGNYIDYQYFSDTLLGEEIESLIFRNTDEPVVSKRLLIKDIDPFNNLPYTVTETAGHNTRFYDLQKYAPAQILPVVVNNLYSPVLNHNTRFQSGRTSVNCSGDKDHALLIFSFACGQKYQNLVSYSRLLIYNNQGAKIFSVEDRDGFIWDAKLDSKGEYLSYRFAIGNSDTVLKAGYRLYNLQHPAVSVKIGVDNAAGQFVAPGLFIVYTDALINGMNPATTLHVYDLRNNIIYTKTYDNERLKGLVSYNNNGLMFNGNKTELFVNDFEGEDLSWEKYSAVGN